jgi:hypothetical protein
MPRMHTDSINMTTTTPTIITATAPKIWPIPAAHCTHILPASFRPQS